MKTNEARVYFALDGASFDPNELTDFLGVDPTSIRIKGEKVPGKLPKKNSWILSTDNVVSDFIDIFEMAASVSKQLTPINELILEAINRFNLTPRFEVVLWISVNEEHSTPAIGFEVETIKFLGEIGAFIDIDTYRH